MSSGKGDPPEERLLRALFLAAMRKGLLLPDKAFLTKNEETSDETPDPEEVLAAARRRRRERGTPRDSERLDAEFARAAREGKRDLTPEVETRMRRGRERAERESDDGTEADD